MTNKPLKKSKSAFSREGMFNEANPLIFELAKSLRKNMTDAEKVLWGYLKAGLKGLKFRRQHPLGIYIADFYCHKIRLVIEVDGNIHEKDDVKLYDIKRETELKNEGYRVVRFTNDKVLKEIVTVIAEIGLIAENLSKSSK
ncbi:endonuclease domain-containing protein [Foetidibacter luteolus]|uniref:endonuclease domain-containing protein n=1 Tax=Foetidibacter luteolus TaxID=2608880 RepID=UPI001A98FFC4|nr:DUF559 domain-containing protein [Foetidibacter luteolus]